ncbi:c-type cytochrome [Microbulbifer sp. CAU 1566]|uniref:c-type cytochrome n=1 Tax=unclassified Microbulbifer TaxID=2619833 RepID=UPI001F454703|nr:MULTISPECIES: c-type cytochrome [unclassified Microbulbifer]MCK7597734.1 c-type cytochrome [Microbulbifer sp. CAU 1566]
MSAHTFSHAVAAFAFSALLFGCSEKSSEVTAPEAPAQDVAVQEMTDQKVETQPVTEVDAVHISPKLLETYQQTCGGCHEKGLVGAPATGDVGAWKPRLAKGMDTMVKHARDGFNAMPPAGLCFHCSDEDYVALITYMSTAK